MEAHLIALLLADPALAALVGGRIRPLRRMQGADLPAITLRRIGGAPIHTHAGPADLSRARLQIDIWAEFLADALAVRDAAAAILDAAADPAGPIRAALRRDARDLSEAEGTLVRLSLDYHIWHQEA